MQEIVEPTAWVADPARATVQITIHTDQGRGDVVVDALRNEAAEHLRSDLEMFSSSCRGDRIKLLTDDVRTVAMIARAAEPSVYVVGSPRYT